MSDRNAFMADLYEIRKKSPPHIEVDILRLEMKWAGQPVYVQCPNKAEMRVADVAARVAEGLPTRIIAERLCGPHKCSRRTIERDIEILRRVSLRGDVK